jgi:ATP-dependent RNA helicase SUPV3L1/SUV3
MTQSFSNRPPERVIGVLGPTNTGKTHYAIERMLAHRTGMIGLPLRLLAREIYDRIVAAKGAESVALLTGEEKIVPKAPAYWVCTVESMPVNLGTEFLAVDEIQMCADAERGHVFTDRLLHARGTEETLFLGAESMRGLIQRLVPHAQFITRPRLSDLAYTGAKKLTRLPRRTAVVAFTANEVYAIAELIRRQRGGAAVVMGALSPRTRNAQVALYQSGEVDFLVATDAIGMGLNMDVDHIAFASLEKFDGETTRALRAQELAQIAGRAGRYLNDGTFGVTGEAGEIEPTVIEQIESHRFDPVRVAQWRNTHLDFSSLEKLITSLEALPSLKGLQRARPSTDLVALKILKETPETAAKADGREKVKLLWEVCQVPDFRKITIDEHARLLAKLFDQLSTESRVIDADWLKGQIETLDNTEGEIDAVQARLAHIRTWAYVANRPGWLADSATWMARAREIEDRLSDALHEKLTERFIDRRTSVLMRKLRDDEDFFATVGEDGEVLVDGEYIGRLEGLRFVADPRAAGLHGRALKTAAFRGLQGEIAKRAHEIAQGDDKAFSLSEHGRVWWNGAIVATLEAGHTALKPRVVLQADEQITPTAWARAETRVREWVETRVAHTLKPLFDVQAAIEADGEAALPSTARGLAFRLTETMGAIDRELVRTDVERLTQAERAALRKLGVKFARFSIFMPQLIKPEAARLMGLLTSVKAGLNPLPRLPNAGLTSVSTDPSVPPPVYGATGYRILGPRAVRLDMLERLGETIEAKRGADKKLPPFAISPDMLSILGCSPDEMAGILRALGFKAEGAKSESGADILLWRPRRRHDGERPYHQGQPRRQDEATASDAAPQSAGTGDKAASRNDGERRRPRRRKPHHERQPQSDGVPSAATDGKLESRPPHQGRDDRPRRERPNFGKVNEDRATRSEGSRDRPADRRFDSNAGKAPPPRFERKEKQADPNSPFAILAKLKGGA